jgi:Phage derived protein Gp49-like (DUF891)
MKPLYFVGQSKKDLLALPKEVRQEIGFTLYLAQCGDWALNAVPLVGFGGSKILEVVIDHDSNTYRAVCADLTAAGFRDVKVDRIARTARAASARDAAVIMVQGSLLRTAIEAADPSRLGDDQSRRASHVDSVRRRTGRREDEGANRHDDKAEILIPAGPNGALSARYRWLDDSNSDPCCGRTW